MPRNVRNFWIEADIDGRKSAFASGPVRADGGISLRILQRDGGGIITALRVNGYVDREGRITLEVSAPDSANCVGGDAGPIIVRTVR